MTDESDKSGCLAGLRVLDLSRKRSVAVEVGTDESVRHRMVTSYWQSAMTRSSDDGQR